jgi:small GTP-binding protein
MMEDALTFRVVLIGDSGAGKTSILNALARRTFEPHQPNTVCALFHTVTRSVDGQRVVMQIWDTAGQEKYRSIGPIYYRDAAAAIAVFDVTAHNFQTNLDSWIVGVKRIASDPLIFVVGNKADLLADQTDAIIRIRAFAQKHDAQFFLTSAQHRINIDTLFQAVFNGVVRNAKERSGAVVQTIKENSKEDCC